MKKLDVILLTGLIGSILFSNLAGFGNTLDNIEHEVLRLHILANSDTEYDQNLKICVRDRLLENSEELFGGCETLDEMKQRANEKLDEINDMVLDVIHEKGYNYNSKTQLVNMEFDNREYGDITMPAGTYDALRITIGEAKGHNWWCVMYPPLCIPAAEEADGDMQTAQSYFSEEELDIMENPENYKVKFKCVEMFRGIRSKLEEMF
ncbi:stage II sporulation protein R [Porcipelethomonas sp.]|uniref:stage II sporulation protein R n=1 Tax=Porcipelethomonas sp. TaxID=2981675 RepID=UPI003EF1E910